jgi:DNA-binding transcriptional LysR family regulator
VALSEAGELFADRAHKIVADLEAAVAEVRGTNGGEVRVRLGCIPYFPVSRLQSLLDICASLQPDLEIEVIHTLSVHQKRRLRWGELDLGIVYFTGKEPGLETEALYPREAAAAFLRADHPLTALEVLRPSDVARETLFLLPRSVQPRLYDATLASIENAGFRFGEVRESGSDDPRDLVLAAVRASGMTIAAPWFAAGDEYVGVVTQRPLDPPIPVPEIVLAWRTNSPPRLREAIASARTAARMVRGRAAPGT